MEADADGADDLVAREGDRPLDMAALLEACGLAPDPRQGATFLKRVGDAEVVGGDAGDRQQALDGGRVVLANGAEHEAVGAENGDIGHCVSSRVAGSGRQDRGERRRRLVEMRHQASSCIRSGPH
jgi:hypothetical protein